MCIRDRYSFAGTIPTDSARTGPLDYVLTVYQGDRATTYPGAIDGAPSAWDSAASAVWRTHVVPRTAPVVLFDANQDQSRVVNPGYVPGARVRSDWIAGSQPGYTAWLAGVDGFGPTAQHVAFRTNLRDGARARMVSALEGAIHDAVLRVRVRAQGARDVPLEIALVLADGSAWGSTVQASATWREIELPVRELRAVPLALVPRPYPTFLPYDLVVTGASGISDLRAIEAIQWGFPRRAESGDELAQRVEIEWVQLVRSSRP